MIASRSRTTPRSAEGRGGPHGGVFLDISHRGKDFILEQLPRMYRQFIEYQLLDISTTPMEVAPTAHYTMGGLVVDPATHGTGIDGLFAAGECTAGLHGANRLGGNSLTETIVYGRRAGEAAAAFSAATDIGMHPRAAIRGRVRRARRSRAPRYRAGTPRSSASCAISCGRIAAWYATRGRSPMVSAGSPTCATRVKHVDVRPSEEGWNDLAQVLDLQAGLTVAEATLRGALVRTETRGCHNRSDFPELDPALQVNFQMRLTSEGALSDPAPVAVPPVPAELQEWLEKPWDIDFEGRLLE